MIELLIVLAATLIVFGFLLAVLYIHNRRKETQPHIHTCANCTCDKRTATAPGSLKDPDRRLERIAAVAGQPDEGPHSS